MVIFPWVVGYIFRFVRLVEESSGYSEGRNNG